MFSSAQTSLCLSRRHHDTGKHRQQEFVSQDPSVKAIELSISFHNDPTKPSLGKLKTSVACTTCNLDSEQDHVGVREAGGHVPNV